MDRFPKHVYYEGTLDNILLKKVVLLKNGEKVKFWMEAERGWATAVKRGTLTSLAPDPAPPCPRMHSPTITSLSLSCIHLCKLALNFVEGVHHGERGGVASQHLNSVSGHILSRVGRCGGCSRRSMGKQAREREGLRGIGGGMLIQTPGNVA